jgi:acetolactate synthase-1/2/3 large subunit
MNGLYYTLADAPDPHEDTHMNAPDKTVSPPPPLNESGLRQTDTVAHAVARSLQRHGVRCVFGQSLPTMVLLACEELGIHQIAYRAENAGGYMADAYSRISHETAVVTAQNGPAATLLVAPLAEALKASVPIVAIVQDVNRDQTDRNAFQEFDHVAMFASCTKWARRVIDASRVEDYIDQAFMAANSGRPGPVALMLPADLLLEKAKPSTRRANLGTFPLDRTVADPARISEAAALLAKARAPIVIAGGGVHISGAHDALAALQEAASLPVATTVMGKGAVAETHPLSVGVAAYFMGVNGSTRHLRPLVAEADVVLLVGNRTNQNGTDSWKLYPAGARFIHIDADGNEVGRNHEALRLVGDARLTLEALTAELARQDLAARKAARPALEQRIAQGKQAYLDESAAVRTKDSTPLRPERVMQSLDARLTPDSIVVSDASYSSIWTANYLTALKAGMRFLTPRGMAGIGWGFPMALGAKAARPDAKVFCVVGDGGFGHVWSELETMLRENLPVTLIVLNNQILGYQKHGENAKFSAHTRAVDFKPVDHAAIAAACGVRGVRVKSLAELEAALDSAQNSKEGLLIDVITDENAYPPITVFEPPK